MQRGDIYFLFTALLRAIPFASAAFLFATHTTRLNTISDTSPNVMTRMTLKRDLLSVEGEQS